MTQGPACCFVCGGHHIQIYLEGKDAELRGSSIGSSRVDVSPGRILRCQTCGFGFREMRPSDRELAQLYEQLDVRVYESELPGRKRTAKRHFEIVKRFVRSGRILDIGCASGLFLKLAGDDGWEPFGIEPSEHLYQHARLLLADEGRIIRTTLQDAALPTGFFDVVTFWDVLEHVPDPLCFMRTCASLLKPGGHLFLNVPDLESLPARILGSRWPLLLPEHLNYFTRRSLLLCGEQARLRPKGFGRRAAWFSVGYILSRLSQHRIPGTQFAYRSVGSNAVGKSLIPVLLGELYSVWKRPE